MDNKVSKKRSSILKATKSDDLLEDDLKRKIKPSSILKEENDFSFFKFIKKIFIPRKVDSKGVLKNDKKEFLEVRLIQEVANKDLSINSPLKNLVRDSNLKDYRHISNNPLSNKKFKTIKEQLELEKQTFSKDIELRDIPLIKDQDTKYPLNAQGSNLDSLAELNNLKYLRTKIHKREETTLQKEKRKKKKRHFPFWLILFFVVLLASIIFSYNVLSKGIFFDSFHFGSVKIEKVFLKLENKFILNIDLISIQDQKNSQKANQQASIEEVLNTISKYLQKSVFIISYFKELRIDKIYFNDKDLASIEYTKNSYKVLMPDFNIDFSINESNNSLYFKVDKFNLKNHDLKLDGDIIYHIKNKNLVFDINLVFNDKPREYLSIKGSNDLKQMQLKISSSKITNINFLEQYIDLIDNEHDRDSIKQWLFDKLQFKDLAINDASTTIEFNDIEKSLLENTYLNASVNKARVVLNSGVDPIDIGQARVLFEKGKVKIIPLDASFNGNSIDGSVVEFSNIPDMNIRINIKASNLKLDAPLLGLLKSYGVELPLRQVDTYIQDSKLEDINDNIYEDILAFNPSSTIRNDMLVSGDTQKNTISTNIEIFINHNYDDPNDLVLTVQGIVHAKDTLINVAGLEFQPSVLDVALDINPKEKLVYINGRSVNYKDIANFDIKASLNLDKQEINASTFIKQAKVNSDNLLHIKFEEIANDSPQALSKVSQYQERIVQNEGIFISNYQDKKLQKALLSLVKQVAIKQTNQEGIEELSDDGVQEEKVLHLEDNILGEHDNVEKENPINKYQEDSKNLVEINSNEDGKKSNIDIFNTNIKINNTPINIESQTHKTPDIENSSPQENPIKTDLELDGASQDNQDNQDRQESIKADKNTQENHLNINQDNHEVKQEDITTITSYDEQTQALDKQNNIAKDKHLLTTIEKNKIWEDLKIREVKTRPFKMLSPEEIYKEAKRQIHEEGALKLDADIVDIKDTQIDFNLSFGNGIKLYIPKLNFIFTQDNEGMSVEVKEIDDVAKISPILRFYGISQGNLELNMDDNKDINFAANLVNLDYPIYDLNNQKLNNISVNGYFKDGVVVIKSDKNIDFKMKNSLSILRVDGYKIDVDEAYNSNIEFIKNLLDSNKKDTLVYSSEEIAQEEKIIAQKQKIRKANNLNASDFNIQAKNMQVVFLGYSIPLDESNIRMRDKKIFIDATYGNGVLNINMIRDNIILNARNFSGNFINTILKSQGGKGIVSGGIFSLNGIYRGKNLNASLDIQNTSFTDLKLVQNILSLIEAVPSLIAFKNPNIGVDGYKVKNGKIIFAMNEYYIGLQNILLVGDSMDINGVGIIDIDSKETSINLNISTIKSISNILNKIPVAGYLILGKEGKISTNLNLSGKYTDPKVNITLVGDIIKAPFNIFRRVFTTIDILVDSIKESNG